MFQPQLKLPVLAPVALILAATASMAQAPEGGGGGGQFDVRALFLANCASCHGESGDGQGTTELDRPARSFKDGGFSFGNTPAAVLRTVTYGIPGTPMPSFESAFDRAQREALASYVISLGPGLPAPPENTEMVVEQRAVVVRGMLPPLTPRAVLQPRGLAIGLPSGLSFEYRTDDVRLLGVRQGRFVNRTDWVGRGGTPLEPLGQVVLAMEGGDPGPTFGLAAAALHSKFKGSWVRGATAGLRYELLDDEGLLHARVEESCTNLAISTATGIRRSFVLSDCASGSVALASFRGPQWGSLQASPFAGYSLREDGRMECFITRGVSLVNVGGGSERQALLDGIASDGTASGAAQLVIARLVTKEPAPAEGPERAALWQAILREVQL